MALFRAGLTFCAVAEQIRAEGYTIANVESSDLCQQALGE
jgi:hypothetical protein